jgi:hypothetical protein
MGSVVFFTQARPKVVPTPKFNKRRNSGAL